LVQKPFIDGEPRERIIHRRFWDLTSSGRDLVDIDFSVRMSVILESTSYTNSGTT